MRDAWWDLVHGSVCCGCGRPGRILCAACRADLPHRAVPVRPDPAPPGLTQCVASGAYADPLRALILRHKERGAHALAGPLGEVLAGVVGDLVTGSIRDQDGVTPRAVLVPVPSSVRVVRSRGHDPMLRIVRVAAARLRGAGSAVVVARLLRQWQSTLDQAGLGHEARARNLAGTMAVRLATRRWFDRRGLGASSLVVVCDDVLTTGATVREAQRALQEAGLPCGAIATIAATRRTAPGFGDQFSQSLP